ncbi:MAG TPA: hypothetical protein PLP01_03845 [Phycisphaerae bacterium]|nr:hypothetical protein [Phycisphaerae bacterium]
MTKLFQEAVPSERGTIEDRLPEMLDQVLNRFRRVGVQRICLLAEEMVRARMEQPATAHLAPSPARRN